MFTENFRTNEDKAAYEKAGEIFRSYIAHEDGSLIYWLWKIAQNDLLESMADCPQSRAQYRIRPDQNLTPLAMLQELLEDVRLRSWE
jgi:hypothetical protein